MRRHRGNPILTRADIPEISPFLRDVTSVFNPGAVRMRDRDVLMLRVQTRGRETVLLRAESADGVHFEVGDQIIGIEGLPEPEPFHVYDPRLTRIGDAVYVVASVDTETGCHLLTARWEDSFRLRVLGVTEDRESRNGVLFPERIAGRFCRLERPNARKLASGVATGDAIWLATSDDLINWQLDRPVLAGRAHYWDELLGSGPPPVKTRAGWLHVYHGVATHLGTGIYQAGVCLLDLDDPAQLIARGRNNILEPRELFETVGQVPNVVFPSGLIVSGAKGWPAERMADSGVAPKSGIDSFLDAGVAPNSGFDSGIGADVAPNSGFDSGFDSEGFALPEARVRIYYGAADTCIGLADTTIAELLEECRLG